MAGGSADEQHARRSRAIPIPRLGRVNTGARFEPLDRELQLRIREALTCRPLERALAIVVVHLPRDIDDALELRLHGVERGITEPLADAPCELTVRELDVTLPFSRFGNHQRPRL